MGGGGGSATCAAMMSGAVPTATLDWMLHHLAHPLRVCSDITSTRVASRPAASSLVRHFTQNVHTHLAARASWVGCTRHVRHVCHTPVLCGGVRCGAVRCGAVLQLFAASLADSPARRNTTCAESHRSLPITHRASKLLCKRLAQPIKVDGRGPLYKVELLLPIIRSGPEHVRQVIGPGQQLPIGACSAQQDPICFIIC